MKNYPSLYEKDNYEEISNYYITQSEPYFTKKSMAKAMATNLLNSFL